MNEFNGVTIRQTLNYQLDARNENLVDEGEVKRCAVLQYIKHIDKLIKVLKPYNTHCNILQWKEKSWNFIKMFFEYLWSISASDFANFVYYKVEYCPLKKKKKTKFLVGLSNETIFIKL